MRGRAVPTQRLQVRGHEVTGVVAMTKLEKPKEPRVRPDGVPNVGEQIQILNELDFESDLRDREANGEPHRLSDVEELGLLISWGTPR